MTLKPLSSAVSSPLRVLRAVRTDEVVRAAPTLAKLGVRALWRAGELTARGAVRIGGIAVEGATKGRSVLAIVDDMSFEARRIVLDALGEAPTVRPGHAIEVRVVEEGNPDDSRTVAERVSDLLDLSNDVAVKARAHPAYLRVADEVAPDEARILRLVAEKGPQACVDVRTRRPFGVGSELVAARLSMIGRLAGCSDLDQVQAYLDNLERLGLISFSPEPLADTTAYQVLEVQPEVTEALAQARRGTTLRHSIELTAFGRNFCESAGLTEP
jgi:hypothetical protein